VKTTHSQACGLSGGCAITYVVPSSLIAIDDNASLLAAAKRLDDKLEALMVSALG
jgi:hypothetical protein